ncbi:MAG: OPT/YSL family transporter [Gammaproteobacteria bacterium]|nr:OPT/YSL family transporter [Gammaproteobacteria bacterium]
MPIRNGLTVRALAGGVLLGALLTPCNIYSGLKIGWSFNVSIIALLLSTGFWSLLNRFRAESSTGASYDMGEANITQTTASSSANIISGGLVAPIPALAMISGQNLSLWALIPWVFAVSFLGIWVAWYLRATLIVRWQLPFPTGRATAETLLELFEQGREAALKLRVLLGATLLAALLKYVDVAIMSLPRPSLGFVLPATGKLAGVAGISAKNLTFGIDPSLMLAGFGAIIGVRNGLSLLLGAILAWGVMGPWGLAHGVIQPGPKDLDSSWFASMIEWLLWPGVALMVGAALARFILQVANPRAESGAESSPPMADGARWRRLLGLTVASALVVIAQILIFGIHWFVALLAVPIAFALAMVASRVVGETGIPPIGAIGKVSQLTTGVTAPGDVTANLMGANVAGGAAGQSADLLNDLKVGYQTGMPAGLQVIAQMFGVLTGSLVGSIVYLRLIPDPASQLITEQWPAPAVATWKVVAETLSLGLGEVPVSALWAVAIAGTVGIVGAALQHHGRSRWLPNPAAVGLAMVIPASISMTMFIGSLIAWSLQRCCPSLAQRFVIAAASGLIAGESLTGVGQALFGILG